jgi:PAS domain S-box-containing protein
MGGLLIVVAMQAAAIGALLMRARQRASANRALRESEERFRLMADRAPVIIWTARPDTTLDYVNSTCVDFTGLPIEKLRDEGWLDAVHPEDRDYCAGIYVPAFEARSPFLFEYRARRHDGVYRWLLATGVPKYAPDGSFAGYIGCDIDITERKTGEELIRESRAEIQQLAGRLIEAQDAERARLARDLHDDVSQQLAGLSIALSGLKHRMDELNVSGELQADLRALHERTSALAQNVRHLSHDLHPTVLRHAGLVATLNTYCGEVQRVHGTTLQCNAKGDFASIAPEVALCMYRVAQEALRNIIAHAGASRGDVSLVRTGDAAELTIADDGNGFDVASSVKEGRGLGLVSIAERVRLAKGTLSITSEPKKGTRVCVRIPTKTPAKSDADSGPRDENREHSLS